MNQRQSVIDYCLGRIECNHLVPWIAHDKIVNHVNTQLNIPNPSRGALSLLLLVLWFFWISITKRSHERHFFQSDDGQTFTVASLVSKRILKLLLSSSWQAIELIPDE